MGFSRQEYWSGLPCPPPGDLLNPGIEFMSPTLQADSLLSEPPGKLKNTGMGSLPFSSRIFLTQESNQGLLHCRWILYQLSYQGSPRTTSKVPFSWYLHLPRASTSPQHTHMGHALLCARTHTHTHKRMMILDQVYAYNESCLI